MSSIDLKILKTENLSPPQIVSFFTRPGEFDRIVERGAVFVVGPKGSGKSMILKYLSVPVQIERFKKKGLIGYDEHHIGIYLRGNEHFFGSLKEEMGANGLPSKEWEGRFLHAFNLNVCDLLLRSLEQLGRSGWLGLRQSEEKQVCNRISKMIGFPTKSTLRSLRATVWDELCAINLGTWHPHPTTDTRFLAQLQDILNEFIASFQDRAIVILVDEYHELTDHQRQIISEVLSIRKPTFKIASLPLGFSTERLKKDLVLERGQDYNTVELGTTNVTHESKEFASLEGYFVLMANRRLEPYRIKMESLLQEPQEVFGPGQQTLSKPPRPVYAGLTNYILLCSGNAKTFLDLLSDTLSEWPGKYNKKLPIPAKVQEEVVRTFARKQMDDIEYIPGISAYVFRALMQKIGLLFKNYLSETGRPYLQIGIKDPENLTEGTHDLLATAVQRSYLMAPSHERYSRAGFKLHSITLHNRLLPYFDLPLKTHQVRELAAADLERLVDPKSVIEGTRIKLGTEEQKPKPTESLIPYLGPVQDIVGYIKEKRCVLFVGSGVSAEVGYPTGKQLAELVANKFNLTFVGEDLNTISQRVIATRSRGDLIAYLKELFDRPPAKPNSLFEKIAEMGFTTIFTTNWDSLLEEGMRAKKIKFERIIRDDQIPLTQPVRPHLYKLHGDFDNPDAFVVTDEDMLGVPKKKQLMSNSLMDSLARNHFLFLGYGMNDWDFKTISYLIDQQIGPLKLTSYCTVLTEPKDQEVVLGKKNIRPLRIHAQTLIDALHQKVLKE